MLVYRKHIVKAMNILRADSSIPHDVFHRLQKRYSTSAADIFLGFWLFAFCMAMVYDVFFIKSLGELGIPTMFLYQFVLCAPYLGYHYWVQSVSETTADNKEQALALLADVTQRRIDTKWLEYGVIVYSFVALGLLSVIIYHNELTTLISEGMYGTMVGLIRTGITQQRLTKLQVDIHTLRMQCAPRYSRLIINYDPATAHSSTTTWHSKPI
jgi:hypothetical protein